MDLRRLFLKFYYIMQTLMAPKLKYSQYLYEEILRSYIHTNVRWLDLGCGDHVLPQWRSKEEMEMVKKCKLIVGLDYELDALKKNKSLSMKIRADISNLPFRESSFELVTANMVVEHLDRPKLQFREIRRVLSSGGLFIFHTPNIWGYTTILGRFFPNLLKKRLIHLLDGRREDDIFQTPYRANSRRTIEKLADQISFETVKIKMIVSSAVFAIISPIAFCELIWLRILMMKPFRLLRTNIIAILRRR